MKFAVAPLLLDSFGFLSGWPSFLVWLGAIPISGRFLGVMGVLSSVCIGIRFFRTAGHC